VIVYGPTGLVLVAVVVRVGEFAPIMDDWVSLFTKPE
jgi:hypothetical protein